MNRPISLRTWTCRRSTIGSRVGLLSAVLLAGCALQAPTPRPSAEASGQPACGPAAQATPTLDEATLRDAQAFRERFGLEAGRDWTLAVFADASSVTAFGQRLLPCERAGLEARPRDANALALAIDSHTARFPDEYGGSFIERDGTLVYLFTRHLAEHELAIGRLVHPEAKVSVRPAQWAYVELEKLKDRISIENAWLATEGAAFDSVGIDPAANHVVLRVLSSDPSIADRIARYYGTSTQLRIEVQPNDLALLPRGSLRGRAVDEDGRPVAGLDVNLVPDISGAGPNSDIGLSTGPAGLFGFENIHAVGYEVQLMRFEGHPLVRVVVASRHVIVPANDSVFVEIVVPS
jgi:hypothetical protein